MDSSSYSLTVRFPSGTEFRFCDSIPPVGSSITRQGTSYVVSRVERLSGNEYLLLVDGRETEDPPPISSALVTSADGIGA